MVRMIKGDAIDEENADAMYKENGDAIDEENADTMNKEIADRKPAQWTEACYKRNGHKRGLTRNCTTELDNADFFL